MERRGEGRGRDGRVVRGGGVYGRPGASDYGVAQYCNACLRAWQLTRLLFVYYSVRVLRAVCSVSVILRLGNLPRLNDATASRHSVGLSLYIHSAHWPVV